MILEFSGIMRNRENRWGELRNFNVKKSAGEGKTVFEVEDSYAGIIKKNESNQIKEKTLTF